MLDLGLFRPAAFSIANHSGKLGCKLVEMSLAASLMSPSLFSRICLMLTGRNNLVVLLYLSVFETQHLPRSMVFHMVVPEVKPNAIVWHANDLGLFRPASAFSIANYSGKLGLTLLEMSLAAFCWCHHLSPGSARCFRGEITLLYYFTYLSSGHSSFQRKRYLYSRTRGQAKATVQHMYKVQYLLTVRCMYATIAVKLGVWGCVYLLCSPD